MQNIFSSIRNHIFSSLKFVPQTKRTANITTSVCNYLKEIRESHEGNTLIVEAVYTPSPRENYMLKTTNETNSCPICSLNLDIKHTDVLILSQFLRSDGCMLPRRITGLCKKQQKRVTKMVAMAQKAGLMSNINPPGSKNDPTKRYKWKKYNTYFDESTIKWKPPQKN